MNVFIVSKGETHEGSSIKGVFDSIEKARAFAQTIRDAHSADFTRVKTTWQELAPNYWELECDYVVIKSAEVR